MEQFYAVGKLGVVFFHFGFKLKLTSGQLFIA